MMTGVFGYKKKYDKPELLVFPAPKKRELGSPTLMGVWVESVEKLNTAIKRKK